jgi:hypothetical protein
MPTLNTTCPVCAAPHAKRLSTIHTEGLSTSSGTLESVGQFNTIGRQKITTKGSTKGVTQTAASLAAAPPDAPLFISKGQHKRRAVWFVTGLIALISVIFTLTNASMEIALLVAGAIAAVGVALSLAIDASPLPGEEDEHRLEFTEEYKAYEQWEDTFACGSCGERFVPESIST